MIFDEIERIIEMKVTFCLWADIEGGGVLKNRAWLSKMFVVLIMILLVFFIVIIEFMTLQNDTNNDLTQTAIINSKKQLLKGHVDNVVSVIHESETHTLEHYVNHSKLYANELNHRLAFYLGEQITGEHIEALVEQIKNSPIGEDIRWRTMKSAKEKTIDCILGGAIGDALGNHIEFISIVTIRRHYGTDGITGFVKSPEEITDDTQMTIAIAEALIKAGDQDVETIMTAICDEFIKWRHSPENNRAPGNACLAGVSNMERGVHWSESGVPDSKGCGCRVGDSRHTSLLFDAPNVS